MAGDGAAGARRVPKKATRKHLENVALWYLRRFVASAESLRRVLMRRVEKSARAHDTGRAAGAAMVEDIIVRYRETGLLDDAAFALARAASLHRRGASLRGIRARLVAKGVGAADIEAALAELARVRAEPDIAAAAAYVRRRRIGPWRAPELRDEFRERDLAKLARRGFDYNTARRAIEAPIEPDP